MYRVAPILALTFAATAATAAAPDALESQALTTTFTGATIHLDTPLGTTVPVHYGDNGQVSGEAGAVAFALGSATDRGRWWVENNRLCHRWNTWFDRENQCLRLRLDGSRLFWVRDDGKTGTASLISRREPPPLNIAASQPAQVDMLNALRPAAAPQIPKPILPPASKTPSSPTVKLAVPAKPPTTSATQLPAAMPPAKKSAPAKTPPPVATVATAVPPTTPAREAIPTYKVAFVEDDDVLNVRTGPSTDHDAIGAIPHSAQGVKIMGACEDEWCPIVHRTIRGWVNRYYLVAEQALATQPVMHTSTASRR